MLFRWYRLVGEVLQGHEVARHVPQFPVGHREDRAGAGAEQPQVAGKQPGKQSGAEKSAGHLKTVYGPHFRGKLRNIKGFAQK